jgi:hypothetical protein
LSARKEIEYYKAEKSKTYKEGMSSCLMPSDQNENLVGFFCHTDLENCIGFISILYPRNKKAYTTCKL